MIDVIYAAAGIPLKYQNDRVTDRSKASLIGERARGRLAAAAPRRPSVPPSASPLPDRPVPHQYRGRGGRESAICLSNRREPGALGPRLTSAVRSVLGHPRAGLAADQPSPEEPALL